ncbi:MAG TPA: hypothetical protein VNC50_08390, partial [Planctomycetia bacterium]|nr:hypothetical protein [Planctomycetia bacterium]
AAALAAGTAARAGDGDETPASVTFIGKLEGAPASARIGIVIEGDAFIAYLCSQDAAFNEANSRWYRGPVDGGKFKAEVAGTTISGSVDGENASGEAAGMKFAAATVAEPTLAGLYRAEVATDEGDLVAGWVVDGDEEVAGAVTNKKTKKTATPPPAGKGGEGVPELAVGNGKGSNTAGGKVVSAKNPPKGKLLTAISPEERAQAVASIASKAASLGGTPALAALLQQARRVAAGESPSGALEGKVFKALKKVPKSVLKDYLKNWDLTPKDVRDRILGPAEALLSTKAPLTLDLARRVLGAKAGGARNGSQSQITSILVTKIKCVDDTAELGRDEVFATYLVVSGAKGFDRTTTAQAFKKGEERTFSGKDARIWPPEDDADAKTSEDVLVTVSLIEDDAGDIARTRDLVKSLVKGAGEILTAAGKEEIAKFAPAAETLVDGISAALPTNRLLGSDSLVVQPDGKTTDENGKAKKSFTVIQKRKNGKVRSQYEIKGIVVR